MIFTEFQVACRRTAKDEPPHEKLSHALEGLVDEVGEIAKNIKKHNRYGVALDVENLREETGDLLYYTAMLLDSIGADMSEIAQENIEKLAKRYPEKFTNFHAVTRLDKSDS